MGGFTSSSSAAPAVHRAGGGGLPAGGGGAIAAGSCKSSGSVVSNQSVAGAATVPEPVANSKSGSTPKMYRTAASAVGLLLSGVGCRVTRGITRDWVRRAKGVHQRTSAITDSFWTVDDTPTTTMQSLLIPLALGFSPGLVPRTNGVEQRATVAMAAKRIALGIVGPGLVGGEVMAQIEATTALLEKQGLDVVMAAVSELKPDADGKLQGWQICSDTSLSIADFKAALADPAAGEVCQPGLEPQSNRLGPRTSKSVTHASAPCLGQAGDFGRMADHLTSGRPRTRTLLDSAPTLSR